jgi:hypothetical protein
MIYEIWCNGKLHYTRPEGHPDIQEALDLIERSKRLFGVSAYEVRAQPCVHPTNGGLCAICGGAAWTHSVRDHEFAAPAISG